MGIVFKSRNLRGNRRNSWDRIHCNITCIIGKGTYVGGDCWDGWDRIHRNIPRIVGKSGNIRGYGRNRGLVHNLCRPAGGIPVGIHLSWHVSRSDESRVVGQFPCRGRNYRLVNQVVVVLVPSIELRIGFSVRSKIVCIILKCRNLRGNGRNSGNGIHGNVTCVIDESAYVGRKIGGSHVVVGNQIVLRDVVLGGEHTFSNVTRVIGKCRNIRWYGRYRVHCNVTRIIDE